MSSRFRGIPVTLPGSAREQKRRFLHPYRQREVCLRHGQLRDGLQGLLALHLLRLQAQRRLQQDLSLSH